MSQASELIAEVKAIVSKVEKDLKAFEKTSVGGEVITAFTDLAHLNKMVIHGREFAAVINRHANPVPVAADQDDPVATAEPETSETPAAETPGEPVATDDTTVAATIEEPAAAEPAEASPDADEATAGETGASEG